MSTRKRKQDEELVALPSDESEEEEEYVSLAHPFHHQRITTASIGVSAASAPVTALQCAALLMLLLPLRPKGLYPFPRLS
ncbi:hypothetical protein N431DRAFT_435734 [Stipitochalara longipes BDJ]|nr:hypothetical protein N431DRAFT_435734 [Stipitochalara longipes BDJ]